MQLFSRIKQSNTTPRIYPLFIYQIPSSQIHFQHLINQHKSCFFLPERVSNGDYSISFLAGQVLSRVSLSAKLTLLNPGHYFSHCVCSLETKNSVQFLFI